jgi:hypothetical protein
MKRILLAAAFSFTPALLFAETEFVLKKIEPTLVESPTIQSNYRKSSTGRPSHWLEIEVTLDRSSTDKDAEPVSGDVTFQYYLLLNNSAITEDGKRTLLTGKVAHSDFPLEKGLHVAAFVSPQTLLKYFDGKPPTTIQQAVVDAGVVATSGSESPEPLSWKSKISSGKGWWDDTSTFNVVEGKIVGKSQTPFAHLASDYHQPDLPASR